MRKAPQRTWRAGPGYFERAILEPAERPTLLRRALQALICGLPAAGTALIRPDPQRTAPWRVEYAGAARKVMWRWISGHLDPSLEVVEANLETGAPCSPGTPPLVISLVADGTSRAGLWILWPHEGARLGDHGAEIAAFRRGLESLLAVERAEGAFFGDASDPLGPELSRALMGGDEQGLPTLLTLARMVASADLAYWGGVRDGVVEIERHVGTKEAGFGFELPVGQGVGGRAFARSEILNVPDYLNCQYRYPGVSDVTDKEGVRSTIAVPVRSSTPESGAVLYAVRRKVAPFTDVQRALLLRLKTSVEPTLDPPPVSRRVFVPGEYIRRRGKSELRRILLNSKEVREIETWLERMVKGSVVSVDDDGHPYVLANSERLERLRLSEGARHPRSVPLSERGQLLLWPSVGLPLAGWPDLLEDAATACGVVIDRMEQAHDRFHRQRSQWIRSLAEGWASPQLRREGDRLGLPTDRGEVWAVAWGAKTSAVSICRPKMLAEEVVLDQLGAPLTVLDDIGVILLRERARKEPSAVRDELLRYFGPAPLWLVHGAGYDSFEGLKNSLRQTITAAEDARRECDERHVLEINSRGLDGLLENARFSDELSGFASNMLEPLLDHDEKTGSRLTETFCHTLTLGSPAEAAKRLFVHANTIRYRMHRAEQILGRDLSSPKEKIAMSLAAFIWLRHNKLPGRNL